jgi:hypothetical protein
MMTTMNPISFETAGKAIRRAIFYYFTRSNALTNFQASVESDSIAVYCLLIKFHYTTII